MTDSRFQSVEDALSAADTAIDGVKTEIATLTQELADAIANTSMSADDSAALDAVLVHATAIRDAVVSLEPPAPPAPVVEPSA